MPEPGDRLKHYKIEKLIGKGGMGEVYLAHDSQLDRKVAIKFLPPELAADEPTKTRFEREAKAAAALDHPFICKVYESGEEGGKSYIVMEYIEGQNLQERMDAKPLSLIDSLKIALEISEALEKAHKKGIIHRDLKPPNIMITLQDHVKVMDFGLAKKIMPVGSDLEQTLTQASITEKGTIAGTLAYMSPEQAMGKKLDDRSDIFSLGIIIYEMFSHKHPFSKTTPIETLSAILKDPPPHS
ncbi:serine/threonine protein kinase [Acidobacteriota bacterium]